jgi:hypothetical protein
MPISNASFIRSMLALLGGGTSHFESLSRDRPFGSQSERAKNAADVQDGKASAREPRVSHSAADAESGQREFLLTEDPRYLEAYEVARRIIEAMASNLKLAMQIDSSARDPH